MDSDWAEEQANEVEVLKAIFGEDFNDDSYPEMPVTFRFKARGSCSASQVLC